MKKEWKEQCTLEIITTLLHDTGRLNRQEPPPSDYITKYKKEVEQISDFFEKFIDANIDLYRDIDTVIEEITIGDVYENEEKYGSLVWYEELSTAIDIFFGAME